MRDSRFRPQMNPTIDRKEQEILFTHATYEALNSVKGQSKGQTLIFGYKKTL